MAVMTQLIMAFHDAVPEACHRRGGVVHVDENAARRQVLEQMRRALELAMGGQGQMVAVVAEAGTGKSRLYYEFKATLPAECKVLEAYSVSHGKASAWLPVLDLLRKNFDAWEATTVGADFPEGE